MSGLAVTHLLGILSGFFTALAIGAEGVEFEALGQRASEVPHAGLPGRTLVDDDGVIETLRLGDDAVGMSLDGLGEAVGCVGDSGGVDADALVELET